MMARDYFDAVDELEAKKKERKASRKKAAKGKKSKAPKRKPLYLHLEPDLWHRIRNTCYWLAGPPHLLNQTQLTVTALKKELRRLEKAENEGKPFPPAKAKPTAGRPSKA